MPVSPVVIDDIEDVEEEKKPIIVKVPETSPSKKRWLDSISTPEKDTQASATSPHYRRRYAIKWIFDILLSHTLVYHFIEEELK